MVQPSASRASSPARSPCQQERRRRAALASEQIAAVEPVGVDQALGPARGRAGRCAGTAPPRPARVTSASSVERLAARRARAGVGARREAHDLAAREHGGRHRPRPRQDQDDHRRGGRLLERLEERLRRLARHPLGIVEDEHLARAPSRGGAPPGARARGWRRCGWPGRLAGSARAASARSRAGRDAGVRHRARTPDTAAAVRRRPLAEQRLAKASAAAVRPIRRPDEGVRVGDPAARPARAGEVAAARGWSSDALKRHARSPRRSPRTSASTTAGGRDGADQPDALGLGAEDLEVAPAHAAVEGERLALEAVEPAPPRDAPEALAAGSRSKSSVRSGKTPPVARTFSSRIRSRSTPRPYP